MKKSNLSFYFLSPIKIISGAASLRRLLVASAADWYQAAVDATKSRQREIAEAAEKTRGSIF